MDLQSMEAKGRKIPTVRCPIVMDGEIMSAETLSLVLQK
jgi:hypothetical protein